MSTRIFPRRSESFGDTNNRSPARRPRQVIESTRWLWLKAKGNLKRKDKYTLAEITKVNRHRHCANVLEEDFNAVYTSKNAEEAARFLKARKSSTTSSKSSNVATMTSEIFATSF
ncbi:MAG: transposase [Kiritimatiellia bacterium]